MIPLLVLDTNVVLDAWWFADPVAAALAAAVEAGQARWIATQAMRDEVADVLGRPAFARNPAAGRAVLATFDRCAVLHEAAALSGTPRCADPDDQVFVDLAVSAGARWLVSRDRALQALAVPLRRWDVEVLAPSHWRTGGLTAAAPAKP